MYPQVQRKHSIINDMKKVLFILAVALLVGAPQTANAQQRKKVVKRTATTAKKKVTQQVQTAEVVIDGPVIVDGGHLAFYGIPVIQGESDIIKDLADRGFKKTKDNFGNTNITGTAYGVKCTVFIDEGRGMTIRESKPYTLAQAKKRVAAYQKSYLSESGGKVTQNTLGWNSVEGGNVTIEAGEGTIGISYQNQDEVDFSSKYYDIVVSIFENK